MSDNVKYQRADYTRMVPVWTKCRDTALGQSVIKSKGTTYLPKVNDWDDNYYTEYLKRTIFYNLTNKTIKTLQSMVFRKVPNINIPKGMEYVNTSVTQDGKSLTDFTQDVLAELINPSRVGILIDLPDTSTKGMSQAEYDSKNLKPYLSMYKAESIINWQTSNINNKVQLSLCVLKEAVTIADPKDKYNPKSIIQYRVLELVEGVYTVTIIQDIDGKMIEKSTITPVIQGNNLNYIPFFILNQTGESIEINSYPALNDLIDVNLAHYINSADNENSLHWSGVRTIIVEGWNSEDAIEMGTVLALPNGAKAYFLNPPSDNALREAMKDKEDLMVGLGANLITSKASTSLQTATSSLIQSQGETSIISEIALSLSNVMTRALKILAKWSNIEDDISIQLNVDFNPNRMTGQDASALSGVWEKRGIDLETLWYAMRKGELIDPTRSNDDLKKSLLKESIIRKSITPEE